MYYYRLVFKTRGEADISIPAHTADSQGMTKLFMKSDEVISYAGQMFRCSDIKRVSREWQTDYRTESPQIVELTSEQQEQNRRRLRWIRTYIATYRQGKDTYRRLEAAYRILPPQEREGYRTFFKWYHSPEQVAKRAERDEFRAAHYDVYFPSHTESDAAFKRWKGAKDQLALVEGIFGATAA